MTSFRKDSVRTTIVFTILGDVKPMQDDFSQWFKPNEAEVVVGQNQLIQVELLGDRCTSAGLPLAFTQEQKDDPRFSGYTSISYDFAYLQGDRAVWPQVLRDLFNHMHGREIQAD